MNDENEHQPTAVAPEIPPQTSRVLVALDASRHSLTALAAAAELAAMMHAELRGLYVEDIDLIHLASLPFVHEIGLYSATQRPYDRRIAEREFRTLANQMRHAVAQTAVSARVNWSFEVVRGNVTKELLSASNHVELLTLGRVGRTPGKRLGSTAETILAQAGCPIFLLGDEGLTYPLTLLYTGSPAADRALMIASTLMVGREDALLLLVISDPQQNEAERAQVAAQMEMILGNDGPTVHITNVESAEEAQRVLQSRSHGTLILPAELTLLFESIAASAILAP